MISILFFVATLAKMSSAFTMRENATIELDPYFGLEILVIISVGIFSIILIILLIILHPPQCCNERDISQTIPYQFLPFGSFSSKGSHQKYGPSDLESFYIPADQCRGRDNIRKKLVVKNNQRRFSRQEGIINSTCLPNMPEVTVNRYFPGLHEISRISAMSTMMRKPTSIQVAKPYRKPKLPESKKPLRSILKKSTTSSTIPKTSTFVV